jgi:hypothetical protein
MDQSIKHWAEDLLARVVAALLVGMGRGAAVIRASLVPARLSPGTQTQIIPPRFRTLSTGVTLVQQ